MPTRPYLEKHYKLKENPFESRVDPNVDVAGRKRETKDWTEAIERRKGRRTNAINFIVGDYGFGKTLSLHKITMQYAEDPDVLPVFIKMLPEDKVSNFVVNFIQRILRAIPSDLFDKFTDDQITQLKDSYPEPATIFQRISTGDKDAMLFLRGEISFTLAQVKKLGVRRRIDRAEIAKEYLIGFLFLLKGIGVGSLLLAVDEVEYVFSQMRGANISLVFNALRDLHDLMESASARRLPSSPSNIIFFLGISSAGWKKLNDLSQREQTEGGPIQPLMRRFGSIIELEPLNKNETRDLIELRLRKNRISGEYEEGPLIPYDKSFVEYVHSLSLGNPGEMVKYCDYVLEEGLFLKAKILDKEFAEKALVNQGLIPEPA